MENISGISVEGTAAIIHTGDSLRCRCGCIPNIMGTFEMAALRAKRRQEKADEEVNKKKFEEETQ